MQKKKFEDPEWLRPRPPPPQALPGGVNSGGRRPYGVQKLLQSDMRMKSSQNIDIIQVLKYATKIHHPDINDAEKVCYRTQIPKSNFLIRQYVCMYLYVLGNLSIDVHHDIRR